MKVAVITANIGGFEKPFPYMFQSVPYDFHMFNDDNFPPRVCSMTPRLQARIVKMFGWQMAPNYDYYIWVDSSCSLRHQDSIKWFVEQGEGKDLVVFKHPTRNTIQEEADYLKHRIAINCEYILSRYKNELVDEQMAAIHEDKDFVDNQLFASTAFAYRNNERVREMMVQWWYHTSRFHLVDQLSLPYVMWKVQCTYMVVPVPMRQNVISSPYVTHVRYR